MKWFTKSNDNPDVNVDMQNDGDFAVPTLEPKRIIMTEDLHRRQLEEEIKEKYCKSKK